MAFEMLLVKEGNKLAAADSCSLEILQSVATGEVLVCTGRRPRNPKHHRKLFALLKVVFEAQKFYATIDDLLSALKIATGHFDTGKTVDGYPYMVPKSISFTAMDQTSFNQFYDRAVDVILTKILPGVNRQDLTDQVSDILAGYGPEKRGVA